LHLLPGQVGERQVHAVLDPATEREGHAVPDLATERQVHAVPDPATERQGHAVPDLATERQGHAVLGPAPDPDQRIEVMLRISGGILQGGIRRRNPEPVLLRHQRTSGKVPGSINILLPPGSVLAGRPTG
jgi:hypothetical protein